MYFSNLPNMENKWPYWACMGNGVPPIRTSDPGWSNVLLEYYWNSEFKDSGLIPLWSWASTNITQVSSPNAWEKFSDEHPESMVNLPWALMGTAEAFINKLLDDYPVNKMADYTKQLADVQKQLLERYTEKLEEELLFLGGSLRLTPSQKLEISEALKTKLQEIGTELTNSLTQKSEMLSDRMKNLMAQADKVTPTTEE